MQWPLSREEASLFFRLVVRRYERASLIVTSTKSLSGLGRDLQRPSPGDSDSVWLLHYSGTRNIKDESYRLKEKRRAGLLGRPKPAAEEAEEEDSRGPGPPMTQSDPTPVTSPHPGILGEVNGNSELRSLGLSRLSARLHELGTRFHDRKPVSVEHLHFAIVEIFAGYVFVE